MTVFAIVSAGAMIVTFGTAAPVVLGACTLSFTSGLYGMSNTNEGINQVMLGAAGDSTTVAMNPIRDTVFASNPGLYYTIGEVSTTSCALMLTTAGAASAAIKAGTSIGRAAAVEAGKDAIASIAGNKASEVVYQKTNNEILATMTGAAVGMLTYGGMTKYDSVKNVSGYYKTSEYQTVLSKVVDKDLAETGIKGGSKTISTLGDLSQEQINAIVKYTGDDYANINNSLRGLETVTPENQATINVMKSALDNASLPEDMVLYRGTSTEELGNLKNLAPEELVGEKFVESGFTSTSTDSAVASGTFSGNLQITIDAPSGAHALDISFVSQYSNEVEILFNAGQEMLITSAESKKGILYITVIAE
ncbi:hypothetical protein CG710_011270 [Lachnotalea glycerini]|uniref:ADP ribosyltransferase domain-containing protein n=1 Tax=Lachnotalea glycerini TaxID=1763509 RepID=A0A371JEH4_9FIRM|nr:hypothetical protein CG710_011270 [Lachnotalea glycerini]